MTQIYLEHVTKLTRIFPSSFLMLYSLWRLEGAKVSIQHGLRKAREMKKWPLDRLDRFYPLVFAVKRGCETSKESGHISKTLNFHFDFIF